MDASQEALVDVSIGRFEPSRLRAELIAMLRFEDTPSLTLDERRLDQAWGGVLGRLSRSRDFGGRPLETALLYPDRGPRRVLLVGLGRSSDLAPRRLLEACATAARRARALRTRTLVVALPAPAHVPDLARVAAEGAVLGHHQFTAYRTSGTTPPLRSVKLLVSDAAAVRELQDSVRRGAAWGEAACLARDLTSTPGQDLVPEQLAARASEVAEASGARARVLRVPQLERLGMGALLAVGRGSPNAPCLVVLEREPAGTSRPRSGDTVVLVGKGITFDTGGISIKPREDMHRMKYDMSGAAAVVGVFAALPTIDPPFRVVGLLACAENMPDGRAFKPGDVLRTMDGATVEVTNTDAEGRLVLADALCYARTLDPSRIVDIATLTGAIRVALGTHAAGLFTRDDALANELLAAARQTGDGLWRMPVGEEYAAELRSDTADLVNFAGREGGACLAASFLSRFAGSGSWAHLDIASTGWTSVDRPHETRGPTGFGVRLLLAWLSDRAAASRSISEPRTSDSRRPARARPAPRRKGTRASASGRRAKPTRASRTTGR